MAFEQGRAAVKKVVADFDNRIATDATASRLKIDRRQLVHYDSFSFDADVARILAGLHQE